MVLRVYIAPDENAKYEGEIKENMETPIKVVGKMGEVLLIEAIRGKQKHVRLALYEKGFFGALTPRG